MKKKIWIMVLLIVGLFTGLYLLIILNPPMETGTLASNGDRHVVVVGVGNKGIHEVKIAKVTVNNDEEPFKTKIQVSHALQGFIIVDDETNKEAKKYNFKSLEDVGIQTGTAPSTILEKQNTNKATEDDKLYGITVFHHEPIRQVTIYYRYLGVSFRESVSFQ
ncbi:hypothetical protein M3182_09005 [Mesobacillus maritimus]|uniref:hypothetical protein n=1 Tax=Mesobacillus maritimus TaxID=1643336 RepID=UPI00203A8DA9|nr:hypothetical protein [Mesobacillus maritimus]MCM3585881.1 hypothetical protein [Mesobacillus maritimus]